MKIELGPLGILQIVFITLKLCNVIAWSWFYVLIPLWISLAILALFLTIAFLAIAFCGGKITRR
jgi:hypothetical protein